MDVGITNNLKKGLKVDIVGRSILKVSSSCFLLMIAIDGDLQAAYVDIVDHAKWKYLLSTDGFTASCR